MWRLALLFVAACGRIGFDVGRGGDGGGGGDAPAGSGGPIHHVRPFAQRNPGSTDSDSFTAQANTGDTVLLFVGCQAANAPTTYDVSAPGWTFVTLVPSFGSTTNMYFGQVFIANAPNNAVATVSVQVVGTSCVDLVELGDEFSVDQGPLGASSLLGENGSGATCQGMVNTSSDGEAVWAACHAAQDITAVGAGYTKGADDANGDWSEFKLTSDPANTPESTAFVAPAGEWSMGLVTLRAL